MTDTVARWNGDEGRFTAGVPNRDVTPEDGVDPDALEEAFASGTHSRPDGPDEE